MVWPRPGGSGGGAILEVAILEEIAHVMSCQVVCEDVKEREKSKMGSQAFSSSDWNGGVAVSKNKEGCRRSRFR